MRTEIPTTKPLLVLVDSNALIHRAYHAYPSTLTLPDGMSVNAVYGFASLLLDVLNKFKPEYVVCAFDSPKPTIRHSEFVGYKANRKKTDSALIDQFPLTYRVVDALNIPRYKVDGFEADDIIGTISKLKVLDHSVFKLIVTGDHDLLQLVDEDTFVYMAGTSFSKSKIYGPKDVAIRYQFTPEYITDFKAIKGDPSDNIPGVMGIGDKGATSLILEYGHIDNIYRHISDIKPNLQKKLINSYDMAMLSKRLATIMLDTPLDFNLDSAKLSDFDQEKVIRLFQEFRFKSLIKKLPSNADQSVQGGQPSLFANNNLAKTLSYKSVHSVAAFDTFVDAVKERLFISIYSNGRNCLTQEIFGVALSTDLKSIFIPRSSFSDKLFLDKFNKLMGRHDVMKIVYDLKTIMHQLLDINITIDENAEDIMLMAYLTVQSESGVDFNELAFSLIGTILGDEKSLMGKNYKKGGLAQVAPTEFAKYLVERSIVLKLIYDDLFPRLEKNTKLLDLYRQVEIPTARILNKIERNGILVDSDYLSKFKVKLSAEIDKLTIQIYKTIGHEFNVDSPKQVGEVLFGKLGLPGGRKTKVGNYKTNEGVLRDIIDAHEVVGEILKYREFKKLSSTYTDALISKIDPRTGRIHARFNQAITSSGRLSSSGPNLQNIPAGTGLAAGIRRSFIAPAGSKLISFDISQQELRVVSNLANEGILKKAFKDKVDIHKLTASGMFNVDISKVTKQQRGIGKTMNFSLLYGISEFGLANRLKIDRDIARGFIQKFWETYPNIHKFFELYLEDAKKKGYAETYFGRRRSSKNLSSSNFRIREAARRELMNFPIQGTSADLMKMAMINVNNKFSNFGDLSPKIILQVHDELVVEVRNVSLRRINEFGEVTRECMREVIDFDVSLDVQFKIGDNWSEIK